MATDWEANLRTLIKNTEKDADFLRRGSSWKVCGVRGKTQVTTRLQEGLGRTILDLAACWILSEKIYNIYKQSIFNQ